MCNDTRVAKQLLVFSYPVIIHTDTYGIEHNLKLSISTEQKSKLWRHQGCQVLILVICNDT